LNSEKHKNKISKQRNWMNINWNQGSARGCGGDITWSEMATVPVPEEFQVVHISTEDVPMLEEEHLPKYRERFNLCLAKIKKLSPF